MVNNVCCFTVSEASCFHTHEGVISNRKPLMSYRHLYDRYSQCHSFIVGIIGKVYGRYRLLLGDLFR